MNSRDMVIGFGAHEKNPDQLKHLVVFEQGRLSHRSVLQVGQVRHTFFYSPKLELIACR